MTADVVVWSVLSLIVLLVGIGVLFAAFGRWGERMGWRGRAGRHDLVPPPGDVARHPDPAGLRLLLPGGRPAVRHPDPGGRGQRALPGRPDQLLRLRPGPLAALQPGPHLARPAVDLLDRDVVPGGRALPGPHRLRPRAAPTVLAGLRAAGSAGRGRVRQPDRRVLDIHGWLSPALHADRDAGLGVPGPGPALAGPAHARACSSGRSCCSAGCAARCADSRGSTCPGCSSSPGSRSRRSTRWDCSTSSESSYTVADFWRFMVVHLWVEDFLEIFTTVLVAYLFVLLGVVRAARRHDDHLPRHHPVLARRRRRHHAPSVLLRHRRRRRWRWARSSPRPRCCR